MREFRIFAELPDGTGGTIYEEFDYICLDNYPDNVDVGYFKNLALSLYPDVLFVQVYELAEEISMKRKDK